MNSIIINVDDSVDVNVVYDKIRELYPEFKIVKKQEAKKKITMKDFEKYCGMVSSDIDEKAELEESRRERFL